jgi:hypothetical protein
MLVRHVFVVKGHHIAAFGERSQVLERPAVADRDVRSNQRRSVVRGGSQQPQGQAQRDSRLVRHARELTRPDHAHHRKTGSRVHEERD